jgi:hypothetical protein
MNEGNKWWQARSSHGRKPKFANKEALFNAACEYFQWVDDNPLKKAVVYQGEVREQEEPLMRAMTIEGLCLFLDIDQQTLTNYETRDGFFGVVKKIKDIIRQQKFEGASAGMLNPNIIARDLGLSDKTESKQIVMSHEEWLETLE